MVLMETELASLKQDKLQLQQQLDNVNRSLISALNQQAMDINNTLTQKINTEVSQLTQQAVDIIQTLTQRLPDLEAIQQMDKASLTHMIQGGCSGPVLTV